MKKLHFLFLTVGGLMILGCPLGLGGGERHGGTAQEKLTVTSSPSDGGTVDRSPDQTEYAYGSNVTLTANPASGYEFSGWEGDAIGSASDPRRTYANPIMIELEGDKTLTAFFTRMYVLTVAASPLDGGIVVRQPMVAFAGSDDETPNQTRYPSGLFVRVMANPVSGYEFTRWEGDVTGSPNPTEIAIDGDKTVTAVFTPATTPLIRLSTSGLKFAVSEEGGPYSSQDSVVQKVVITNRGVDILSGLDCSFPEGRLGWLSATLSGSTAPATLTVTLALSELPGGHDVSTRIAITSAAASNSPQYIHVDVYHCAEETHESAPSGPPIVIPDHIGYQQTVICTELHRQGLMDEAIFKADEAFGRYLRDNQKEVLLGYHLWAKPVVSLMQKSCAFTQIVNVLATPWSYEMAYRMGAKEKGSFVGKLLLDVGVPVCRTIGRAMILAGNAGRATGQESRL